jgi:hypothetical protein
VPGSIQFTRTAQHQPAARPCKKQFENEVLRESSAERHPEPVQHDMQSKNFDATLDVGSLYSIGRGGGLTEIGVNQQRQLIILEVLGQLVRS